MLGHADIGQTQTYLSTNLDDMRAAVRKRDKIDYDIELEMIFEKTSAGKLKPDEFKERVKKLFN